MTTAEQGLADAGPPVSPRADSPSTPPGRPGMFGTQDRGAHLARDERRPITAAFLCAIGAFVPTVAVATAVAGPRGTLGALVGTLLVLVLFGAGAAMMMWAGRRGPSTMTMVAAAGVAARLMLYAAVLIGLDGTDLVHRPSLAVATAVTLVITLAGELAVLARTPSLFHLHVPATAPSARPRDDRADRSTTQ